MRKVFWDDPYQQRLMTKVTAVNDNCILLDETIAFSFSGGQESDKAYINNLPVLDSVIDGYLIYYSVAKEHALLVGDQVCMEIDWPRRYKLMRLHFAAELVLEIVSQQAGIEKIGAHIAETKARIDFMYSGNISTYFEEILSQYNKIIIQDMAIKTGYSDVVNQRRYWEIEGFSKVACGGTHVKSTQEVGFVGLKRVNVGGGKERIEIRLLDADGTSRRG